MPTPLADALPAAQATFRAFLDGVPRGARLVVFGHFDADGLAAAALLGRGLPRLGCTNVEVVASGKGESAFGDGARARLAALRPDALVVTDLGVNAAGVLPDVPALYVDHHRPEGDPPGPAHVVSGYEWDPIPCSAWLAHSLLAGETDVSDLDWIAAVGVLSDLGDKAPWPPLADVKKRHTATALKEAVALVNAARRAAAFDVATPLAALLTADGPKALALGETGARLAGYRAEVAAALAEARKAAPAFSETEPFALLRLDTPCQIHPLIAQQWRTRLPKYAVIAANRGYLPGLVAFSTRTAIPGFSLPERYRRVDLGEHNAAFGHGHDAASGGHLPPDAFAALLRALGFPDAVATGYEG